MGAFFIKILAFLRLTNFYLEYVFPHAENGSYNDISIIKKFARAGDAHALAMYGLLCERGQVDGKGIEEAFKYYSQSASKRSILGMNNLACMYMDGTGVKKDKAKAMELLQRVAKKNFVMGQFNYAALLEDMALSEHCEDREKCLKEALKYYKKTYQKKLPEAVCKFATMYLEGSEHFAIKQNPPRGISMLKKIAHESVGAMKRLAVAYEAGEHVPLSYKKAFSYWHEAADSGDAEAQYLLYHYYSKGLGVAEDNDAARYWLETSAKKNFTDAMLELSELHANGGFGSRNTAKSRHIMEKAAVEWNPNALIKLAEMELESQMGRSCLERAYDCYKRASEMGSDTARLKMAALCLGKLERPKEGIALLKDGAQMELPEFANRLGREYEKGAHVDYDPSAAFDLYLQAAAKNYAPAIYNLAKMHEYGIGTDKNPAQALKLYDKASKAGCLDAYFEMARSYLYGDFVEADYGKAAGIFEMLAMRGHGQSKAYVGYMCESGLGRERNEKEAAAYYMGAYANADSAFAAYRLSGLYKDGRGVERDDHKAFTYLRFAANKKHTDAMKELAKKYRSGFPSQANITKAEELEREIENIKTPPEADVRLD